MDLDKIYCMDAFEGLMQTPDKSVDLVIIDPPYNIGVKTMVNGVKRVNAWDKIENYQEWMRQLLKEVARTLKDNGVMYMWHNDMPQIAELLHNVANDNLFSFRSFCIWDKGESYRARSWKNRKSDSRAALRSWFNICEYCLHFFKISDLDRSHGTGIERINSNPGCYRPLKDWYQNELRRLSISKEDVARYYTKVTGKKPYMLRHYFQDSQFEIPTQKIWESVYVPLGFNKEYEGLRNIHHMDSMHCNVWHRRPINSQNRFHTCQKPLDITERMIRVSSNAGAVVLDPFMGSGTTAIAAMHEGRHFIGFERDVKYFDIAEKRIEDERQILYIEA